jgi:hypothetical protein
MWPNAQCYLSYIPPLPPITGPQTQNMQFFHALSTKCIATVPSQNGVYQAVRRHEPLGVERNVSKYALLPTELAWQIPIACIRCWDTPDDGQWTCPKHVQYFIK